MTLFISLSVFFAVGFFGDFYFFPKPSPEIVSDYTLNHASSVPE